MASAQVDDLALDPIRSLPDQPFLDVLATILASISATAPLRFPFPAAILSAGRSDARRIIARRRLA
jgi:hypothetical protein